MTPQAYRYLLGQVASRVNWIDFTFTREIGDYLDVFSLPLSLVESR